ncbi:GTPase Era [Deferribacter autotrophicus]|uniref:GTPase Era n=1 Tax=Deferribacter autotrophicus TaxID=500465 RepID=A0A5A8F7A4_9BACT|nr:GTPase Era [Deferribacter autotrophicus]KAA0259473.1 GTPase Era [Deferribacter autotrophicus]
MGFKCGFVSIIGRPNVGKSTLLNRILDEKVTIVSSKPNTTRTNIKGVKTGENYQLILIDTPGIHIAKDKINRLMVQNALDSLEMVDIVYFMVEPGEFIGKEIKFILEVLKKYEGKKYLLINKVDKSTKTKAINTANEIFKYLEFDYVLPISALKGINIDKLIDLTVKDLPENYKIFDNDYITDIPEKFLIAEFVREQIFRLLKEEVPYDTVVECEMVEDRSENLLYTACSIIISRESQKPILLGKRGRTIKEIGKRARENLEKFFGVKVYLDLWVKVVNNWQEKDEYLKIQRLL